MYPVINTIETGQKIKSLMNERGLSPTDIKEYLSLSCIQSVYRWLNGTNIPSIDNLYALSELFQVPIDDIVQGNKNTYYHIVKETNINHYIVY